MAAEIEMERCDEISRRRVKCYTRVSRLASRAHQFTRPEKKFLHVHITHPPTHLPKRCGNRVLREIESYLQLKCNPSLLSSARHGSTGIVLFLCVCMYRLSVCLSVCVCVCDCLLLCYTRHDTYDAIAATEKRHFEKGDDDSIATR